MPPPSTTTTTATTEEEFYCEKFDLAKCKNDNSTCQPTRHACERHVGIEPACFALWTNSSDQGVNILHKGCWTSQTDIKQCSPNECVTHRPQTNKNVITYFCCCEKPNCNDEIYFNATSTTDRNEKDGVTCAPPIQQRVDLLTGCLFVIVPIIFVATLAFIAYSIYRRCKFKRLSKTDVAATTSLDGVTFTTKNCSSAPLLSVEPLEMIDIIARGRFGCVWKARRRDDVVAVKVFPPQAMDSWLLEQEIYSLISVTDCENLLKFISAEERGVDLNLQYYLVTEYHAHGSLYDYLKGHTLNSTEFFHISTTMLKGLAFLHEEIIKNDKIYKPTIVHRDFKSRNVLLKNDLTACVADFGLALKCEHGRTPKDTHNQVGTHRYMAPEVLESATEFSAFAFKQIDVYAASLVLWEILSRCTFDQDLVEEYLLPYEKEIGSKPSLNEMQDLVVTKRRRPILKTVWKEHIVFGNVCKTLEEMWDMEPEARITAGCVLERLISLKDSTTIDGMALLSNDASNNQRETAPLIHWRSR